MIRVKRKNEKKTPRSTDNQRWNTILYIVGLAGWYYCVKAMCRKYWAHVIMSRVGDCYKLNVFQYLDLASHIVI